jgi:hypothetical protein
MGENVVKMEFVLEGRSVFVNKIQQRQGFGTGREKLLDR